MPALHKYVNYSPFNSALTHFFFNYKVDPVLKKKGMHVLSDAWEGEYI